VSKIEEKSNENKDKLIGKGIRKRRKNEII
jgi:hypothetical protein